MSLGALALIDVVVDPGTWSCWDEPISGVPQDVRYAEALAGARKKTGLDESVVTGEGRIAGRQVAIVACEFGFLAGSIGVAAAERLVRAVERATEQGLPLLAAPTSGGTRMQEGAMAFLQMVKITAAIGRHKALGNPYLVYLRHPTFGGVFASWGSLGHVTVAEPGAAIGFLGSRVFESIYGEPFPADVQTAENLFAHGLVDAVLPPERLPALTRAALNVLSGPRERRGAQLPAHLAAGTPDGVEGVGASAWDSITRSRRTDRPGVRQLLRAVASDVVVLHGTGAGETGSGLLLALARFGDAPCVLLGQDRKAQTEGALIGPGALREARRGMRLAEELKLPLVTVIDTPGAALSRDAEQGGLVGEIARSLVDLVLLDAPTVCLLLGEGTGGAALALLPTDRVLCAEHAWLSPLPPEGASAIVHRTTERAAEMAEQQRVRSTDLLEDGIVDRLVSEHPDAADEPEAFLGRVGRLLESEILGLLDRPPEPRLAARIERYRRLGGVSS